MPAAIWFLNTHARDTGSENAWAGPIAVKPR
jgi:hypothetical protein